MCAHVCAHVRARVCACVCARVYVCVCVFVWVCICLLEAARVVTVVARSLPTCGYLNCDKAPHSFLHTREIKQAMKTTPNVTHSTPTLTLPHVQSSRTPVRGLVGGP